MEPNASTLQRKSIHSPWLRANRSARNRRRCCKVADKFEVFVKLMEEGVRLRDEDQPVLADVAFDAWVSSVAKALQSQFPDCGFAMEWYALGDSPLVREGGYHIILNHG